MKAMSALLIAFTVLLLAGCGWPNSTHKSKVSSQLKAQGLHVLQVRFIDDGQYYQALIEARSCKMWFEVEQSHGTHAIWQRGNQYPDVVVTPQVAGSVAEHACGSK